MGKREMMKMIRHYEVNGFRKAIEGFDIIWSVLVRNLAADADLTDEQTAKLCRIGEEMRLVLGGGIEMQMDNDEWSEYLAGKAQEASNRLHKIWE